MPWVHLGFFEGFKSRDTLLMEGDANGLLEYGPEWWARHG